MMPRLLLLLSCGVAWRAPASRPRPRCALRAEAPDSEFVSELDDRDRAHLWRTVALASKALGRTRPNPAVRRTPRTARAPLARA